MTPKYTTAFICITLSGELYVARQYKGSSLLDCAKWRSQNRQDILERYGEAREVTIQHKNK